MFDVSIGLEISLNRADGSTCDWNGWSGRYHHNVDTLRSVYEHLFGHIKRKADELISCCKRREECPDESGCNVTMTFRYSCGTIHTHTWKNVTFAHVHAIQHASLDGLARLANLPYESPEIKGIPGPGMPKEARTRLDHVKFS